MKDVFIIGSRGLPAQYGGFETFVEKLVSHKVSPTIRYHVACLSDESTGKHFDYKGADCFYAFDSEPDLNSTVYEQPISMPVGYHRQIGRAHV